MTLNDAREAVYCRLLDNFTGVATEAIALDNEDFNEPLFDPWLRLTVRTNIRRQNTLGRTTNRRFRTQATAFIQVFTQANTGTKAGDVLATEAANIFEGVSFSGLDFKAVTIRESGVNGKWYQHLVETEFDYDELK